VSQAARLKGTSAVRAHWHSRDWPEAAVAISFEQHTDLETLSAVIAHSQIVVADRTSRRRLPAGFDDVDIAILDWIAAEGRRAGRSFVRM
jgi:hypothetical protein